MANKESYAQYILKNPLFLHNEKKTFRNTLTNIKSNRIFNKNYLDKKWARYLDLLSRQEKEVIEMVGGQENLDIILKDISYWNSNIEKINQLLDEIFPNGENEDIGNINRHFINSRGYFNINNAKIKIIKTNGEYDWDKTISEAKANGTLKNFQKAFDKYIKYMNERSLAIASYKQQLQKLIDENVVTSKRNNTPLDTLEKYLSVFGPDKKKCISAEYLEDLRRCSNMLSVLTGYFDEGVEINFSLNVKEIIDNQIIEVSDNEKIKRERADKYTTKNKKPDLLIYKGELNFNNSLLTVSKKTVTVSKSSKTGNAPIHFQKSSLLSKTEEGLYKYLNDEIPGLGDYYLFLVLNATFNKVEEADDLIEKIERTMAHLFISGGLADEKKDRAIYLIVTRRQGNKILGMKLVPIRELLLDIYKDKKGIISFGKSGAKFKDLQTELDKYKTKKREIWEKAQKPESEYYSYLSASKDLKDYILSSESGLINNVITAERAISIQYNSVKAVEYALKKVQEGNGIL